MDAERQQRLEDLYHEASRLPSPARAAFLSDRCGSDMALRVEIESLLAYETSVDAFIEAPALDVAARLLAGAAAERDLTRRGTVVDHFRVLDKLGEGGMGVVYEAVDTRLDRRVALKFLPAIVASNPLALERFAREARAASALNHPNICTIYGIGDADGQPFIAMERLEGQTLRERIAAGGLPLPDVLALTLQIVEGLDAAHAKGIVHRDVKPGNIFVTDRGTAKLLDFGAATLDSAPQSDPGAGTVGYMSPEQASGGPVDARTDLFSLGAVIYEMATGRPAFPGSSVSKIRRAIVEDEPVPPRQVAPGISAGLERIIRRAMEKAPARRYQSAAELRGDILRLQRRPIVRRRLAAGAALAAALLAGAAAFRSIRPDLFADLRVRQITFNASENTVTSGTLSPDGRRVVYSDRTGIHVKVIDTGVTSKLAESGTVLLGGRWDLSPGWLPGGTRLVANLVRGSALEQSSVWIVAPADPPRQVLDRATALAVSPDGTSIAFATQSLRRGFARILLMRLDEPDAAPRVAIEAEPGRYIAGVAWAPDARRLAFISVDAGEADFAIQTRTLSGGPANTVVRAGAPETLIGPVWLPDGRLIYSRRHVLDGTSAGTVPCTHWQVPLDVRTGEARTAPQQMANWLPHCIGPISFSADGMRATYLQGAFEDAIHVADFDGAGDRITGSRRLTFTEGRNIPGGWTADSGAVVFVSDGGGRSAVVRQAIDAEAPQPLAGEAGITGFSRLTPDGGSVLFTALERRGVEGAPQRLLRVPAAGGAIEELAVRRFVDGGVRCAVRPASLCAFGERSADGRHVVWRSFEAQGAGRELVRIEAEAGAAYRWALSPDGTRLAVLDVRRPPVRVLTLADGSIRTLDLPGHQRLGYVNFTADGRRLLVPSVGARGAALLAVDLDGGVRELWEAPGALDIAGIPSPDGRRLALWLRTRKANLWLAERP